MNSEPVPDYDPELHTTDYQKYSYHWQEEDGELIIRWDNKPHWDIKGET